MASSSALIGQSAPAGRVVVPAKWRAGQFILIALVGLLAVWYFSVGWKSPGETNAASSRNVFDALGFIVLAGFVWLCTPVAGVIAMTTFQEALRRRWMTVLLAFGIVLLGLSTFFTWMQPGEEQKFLRDFGVGFIIIMTLLMAIFLGVALVPPDIERRTIFTILSKPVDRLEFLIGKYLGLCLVLLVNLALMSAMFLLSYALFKIRREGYAGAMATDAGHMSVIFDLGNMFKALVLQYGQLMIMAALALTMSLVVSNITAIVFCFLIYFGGQMSSYWEHLGGEGHDAGGADAHGGSGLSKPVQNAIRIVYYALPRLDRFDVRERIVTDVPIGFNYMWKAMGNGMIYVAVLLCIAWLVFSDREF
jgi:ABC-type transport system involved in multi-copper enzyme maturation permease subunit